MFIFSGFFLKLLFLTTCKLLLYSVQYNFKKSLTEPKGFELGFKKTLCIFLNAHLYECFLSLVKINVKRQLAESFSFSCSFSIDSSILPWGKSGQSRKYLCMRLWPLTTLGIRFLCYIVGLFSTHCISITIAKIIVSNFQAMLASKSVSPPLQCLLFSIPKWEVIYGENAVGNNAENYYCRRVL